MRRPTRSSKGSRLPSDSETAARDHQDERKGDFGGISGSGCSSSWDTRSARGNVPAVAERAKRAAAVRPRHVDGSGRIVFLRPHFIVWRNMAEIANHATAAKTGSTADADSHPASEDRPADE